MKRALLFLAIFTAGCQYDPFTREYTTTRVSNAALVGTYSLDGESRDWLVREFAGWSPQSQLVLARDGHFSVTDLPDCWRAFECTRGKTDDVLGTWNVEKLDDYWAVALNVTSINNAPQAFFTAAQLRREKPPYIVHFIVGDPDEGRGLAFEKTAN